MAGCRGSGQMEADRRGVAVKGPRRDLHGDDVTYPGCAHVGPGVCPALLQNATWGHWVSVFFLQSHVNKVKFLKK